MELTTQKITKQFRQGISTIEVLKGITAQFKYGNTYAITGISGAGKSTFLHILAGLEKPTEGQVLFNGKNLDTMNQKEKTYFLNKSIGLVFQLPYLINELSIVENVMIKGMIENNSYEYCLEQARILLKMTGLIAKENSHPSALSGGQQQRIAIIRALFTEPAFLLADEPTGNLDKKTSKDIVSFLLDCHAQWHMGIILNSHDSSVYQAMENCLHLHDGLLKNISIAEKKNIANRSTLSL